MLAYTYIFVFCLLVRPSICQQQQHGVGQESLQLSSNELYEQMPVEEDEDDDLWIEGFQEYGYPLDYETQMHYDQNADFEDEPADVVFRKPKFLEYLTMEIRLIDSECQSRDEISKFTIYFGTLSDDNKLLKWTGVHSDQFDHDRVTRTRTAYVDLPAPNLKSCFNTTPRMCVPHSDVVYIHYENYPQLSWSLQEIHLDVYFAFGLKAGDRHHFDSLLSVLRPCHTIMDEYGWYQLGPKVGLFFKMDQKEWPEADKRVRDWY